MLTCNDCGCNPMTPTIVPAWMHVYGDGEDFYLCNRCHPKRDDITELPRA